MFRDGGEVYGQGPNGGWGAGVKAQAAKAGGDVGVICGVTISQLLRCLGGTGKRGGGKCFAYNFIMSLSYLVWHKE